VQSRQIFYTFVLRTEVHITFEAEMVPTSARIHSKIYTKFATFPGLYFPNFTNFEMLFLASAIHLSFLRTGTTRTNFIAEIKQDRFNIYPTKILNHAVKYVANFGFIFGTRYNIYT
jgi:hypothetical protein